MTQVNPKDFANALYGSFRTHWEALHPDVPVAYPNRPFDPQVAGTGDDAAWVRVYALGDTDQSNTRYSSSVTPAVFLRSGILTIEVYARVGRGVDRAYDLSIDVLSWLEKPTMANVFLTRVEGPVELGPDATWFQLAHQARWRYFTDRPA